MEIPLLWITKVETIYNSPQETMVYLRGYVSNVCIFEKYNANEVLGVISKSKRIGRIE